MPSTYKIATYADVALWQADTKVIYNANPKSGKAFDRYAKYEKARTIEESLSLGSKPELLVLKAHLPKQLTLTAAEADQVNRALPQWLPLFRPLTQSPEVRHDLDVSTLG